MATQMKVFIISFGLLLIGLVFANGRLNAQSIGRISPDQARERVQSGEALLVCSYDDDTCESFLLEGAILRSEFESKLPSLRKDQEIIFYCG